MGSTLNSAAKLREALQVGRGGGRVTKREGGRGRRRKRKKTGVKTGATTCGEFSQEEVNLGLS
jgi:hypothetical protein